LVYIQVAKYMKANTMLEELRKEIDSVDEKILILLKTRLLLMKKIGEEKKNEVKPIRDPQREEEKIQDVQQQAHILNIPTKLVRDIWKLFFEISEEIEK